MQLEVAQLSVSSCKTDFVDAWSSLRTGLVQQDIWNFDQTLGVPWPVCVQLVVICDLPEHLQKQTATQNDSSTDVVVTVLFPALMIYVRCD